MDYAYCSIDDVRDDLGETGSDSTWLTFVKTATQAVEHALGGRFFPKTETRSFDGPGGKVLFVPDLLSSAPTVVNDGITLAATDVVLYPRGRRWENGPYVRVEVDPDAASLSAWTTERDNITLAGKWGWADETEAISGATVQDATQQ